MKKGLKLFLLGLVGLFGGISFGYCQQYVLGNRQTLSSSSTIYFDSSDIFCIQATSNNRSIKIQLNSTGDYISSSLGGLICVNGVNNVYFLHEGNNSAYFIMSGFSSSCSECPSLSGYILESEIDTNYCVGNGYCPTNEFTGGLDPIDSGNWSALYINDFQFIGAGLINLTIPDEIEWDYIYTGNGDKLDIDVVGYNVDSDYIAGIISTQNSKPNNVDFNNIISGLLPTFIPGLVILLFIIFIFRFVKKIF